VLALSACNQTENEQNQHVISNSIELEKSDEEVVTSISGSIPMVNSDTSEADKNLNEVTNNQELIQDTEDLSTDSRAPEDEIASVETQLVNVESQETVPSETNDVDVVVDSSESTITSNTVAETAKTEELITETVVSPIAETEFAKPEKNTELENQTAAQRILTKILNENAVIDYSQVSLNESQKEKINTFCQKINARLSSVSYKDCLASNHKLSPFTSVNGEPIVITEFAPKETREPLGRVLIIGGTHGDELTSVSTSYKWIDNLNRFHSGLFHWHIAPVINPDGVFPRPATRINANGIDINRNLPTPDWEKQSLLRWEKSDKNPRRNPGTEPASEPETQWIMHEIETFKPDAIISIHAPYGILDFDSPKLKTAPSKFGKLKLNLLGTYPGSLGNYAGIEKEIPVLTLELPNAQYMPPQDEINAIWADMIRWLKERLSN